MITTGKRNLGRSSAKILRTAKEPLGTTIG
jgi:hypothetical protein